MDRPRRGPGAVGISLHAVQRIWVAQRLQSHRLRTFKRSRDPAFAAKVEDVVGLYMALPAHAVVLPIDEKSQIQALERTGPGRPLAPGHPAAQTHDYTRHGTTTFRIQTARRFGGWSVPIEVVRPLVWIWSQKDGLDGKAPKAYREAYPSGALPRALQTERLNHVLAKVVSPTRKRTLWKKEETMTYKIVFWRGKREVYAKGLAVRPGSGYHIR